MAFADDMRSWVRRSGAPGTVGILVALVAISLFCWLFRNSALTLLNALAFDRGWLGKPWSILTYPFAYAALGPGFLFFVFELLWVFWVGGTVEREVGTSRFLGIWFAGAAIAALVMWIAALALGVPLALDGPALAIAAITVIWGVRNPNATVLLFFIIPVKALWIAWAAIGFTLFGFGQIHPLLGIAACAHLALAYAFALNRLSGLPYGRSSTRAKPSKEQRLREEAFFGEVRKREQERQDRERLRKLFEGSLNDDDPR